MIVPIVNTVKGQDETIGTARVLPDGKVEYYINPKFSISDMLKKELAAKLRKMAK